MNIPFGQIAVRAIKDEKFREALVASPERALAREFDVEFDKGHQVKVVEDSDEVVHLIVPAKKGSRGAEVGVVAQVLDRMRKDKKFRAALIADPRSVFEKVTGIKLPDKPKFLVVRDSDKLTHVQVPPRKPNEQLVASAQEASDDSWGGGGGGSGGGGWGGEPPEPPEPEPESPTPDCTSIAGNNSATAICCVTQFPNAASAFDCCFDKPGVPGGASSADTMLLPF